MKFKNARYTMVIGAGRLGASLASKYYDSGDDVVIIDVDKRAFERIAPTYGGLIIEADAANMAALESAGIDKADLVLVVTDDDNTNVMLGLMAKRLCFDECDIEVINPTGMSLSRVDELLIKDEAMNELCALETEV